MSELTVVGRRRPDKLLCITQTLRMVLQLSSHLSNGTFSKKEAERQEVIEAFAKIVQSQLRTA